MGKMALVCEKCFAWNGLVEEKRWGDMRESIVLLFGLFTWLTYAIRQMRC
jgi:hypothetical protein